MRPKAFRIRDFKSITDSGVCILSGDGITVLAGQNEAGKTAVLSALRDFDLEGGAAPKTQEYEPDERFDAKPTVSVLFEMDVKEVVSNLEDDNQVVPEVVIKHLTQNPMLWITRDLREGTFSLEDELTALWGSANYSDQEHAPISSETSTTTDGSDGNDTTVIRILEAKEFADYLRDIWPQFVYFDSFQDSLPREVKFDALRTPEGTENPMVPSSVHDFVVMSELDLERITNLGGQDKTLGNYLSSRSATITGDFLTYWKQKVDQDETVDLQVRHIRDTEGTLKLAFYVHDKSDQYPDQRSKGFLWFLSFYLKLAAAQKKYPGRKRILLIDEPGSYLHARAQKDVLHLFEDRIAEKNQIIYSTHSPYLIPPDRLHRLRIGP